MIIKVILIIFAYLLVGIAVLEGMLWRDRKVSFIDEWIDETSDWEQTMTVILWPVILPMLWLYLLNIGLKHLIKCVRIFFTATVYIIAALIDKPSKKLSVPKGWIRCKDKPPEENNYYLVYEKIEDGPNIICVEEYRDGEWIHLDPGQEVIALMPSPEGYKVGNEE